MPDSISNSEVFNSLEMEIHYLETMIGYLIEQIKSIRQASVQELLYDSLSKITGHVDKIHRNLKDLEDERKGLFALSQIGHVVNSSLDTDVVLQIVMDTIIRLSGAERGFLLLQGDNNTFEMRIARNWEQESLHSSEYEISRTIVNRVIEDGQAILTTNAQEDPRFSGQDSIVAYNLTSIICVPLIVKGQIIGVVYADNRIRSGMFTKHELNLLSAFGNQAAVSIENARLFSSVQKSLAEVTELKNLMDSVFKSIVSGVFTVSNKDVITLSNSAASNIFGVKMKQITGKKLQDILPGVYQAIQPYYQSVMTTNKHVTGLEVTPELVKRGKVNLRFDISPLYDANRKRLGGVLVVTDQTEQKKLEAERRLFEKMVSPKVIKQLDPNSVQLGGERKELTILFADLRSFTSFSEKIQPEQLVSILNQYLAVAADAILQEDGTIDKFLGDAVMAWFNAPVPHFDHPLRALKSAVQIQDAVKELNKHLPEELCLSFGIGIHCGEALLGLIGTEKRVDYTAIGDSVNTTKRIQDYAKPGQILISEPVYQLTKEFIKVREFGEFHPRGKKKAINLYELNEILH